jgi:hypothetical protein
MTFFDNLATMVARYFNGQPVRRKTAVDNFGARTAIRG